MTRIYTRSGDEGSTGLSKGKRTAKNSLRIEAIGGLDECNAQIGLLLSHLVEEDELRPTLEQVQHQLFEIGAILAGAECLLSQDDVRNLEHSIDHLGEGLPPLKHFILPGGGLAAATAHVARTVCRRSERQIVALKKSEVGNPTEPPQEILSYINRLSDFLFIIARVLATRDKGDIVWKPNSRALDKKK